MRKKKKLSIKVEAVDRSDDILKVEKKNKIYELSLLEFTNLSI